MKLLVAVKRVVDPYVKIRVKTDQTGVETQNVKMSINPFDEIAVEAALRLREAGQATEVVCLSIGPQAATEVLRHTLALGADRAILIEDTQSHCSLNIAKIIHQVALNEAPQLILMGKQSIDGDNNQTPQMLAGLLDWPQATYASRLTCLESNKIEVVREIDGGLETLILELPAVVSTDLRLNEPRYASLPNIMKAKQKPLEVIPVASLNLTLKQHIEPLKVTPPTERSTGVHVGSVDELIDKLKHEAKVL